METFCTEREWLEIVNRERRWTVIFRILAVLTPAVFTVLCLLTRTGNARVMHGAMLAATAILGGAAIAVYTLQLRPARQERKHLEMLRKEQKTLMEGRLEVTVESFRIPKSVRVRRVILASGKEDERPALLNVDERWVDRLPPDGSLVRIAAVHSYIAGAETLEEKPGPKAEGRKVSRARAFFRGVAAVGPLLVLWAFFTVIFGSFVFYQITDPVYRRRDSGGGPAGGPAGGAAGGSDPDGEDPSVQLYDVRRRGTENRGPVHPSGFPPGTVRRMAGTGG